MSPAEGHTDGRWPCQVNPQDQYLGEGRFTMQEEQHVPRQGRWEVVEICGTPEGSRARSWTFVPGGDGSCDQKRGGDSSVYRKILLGL